MFNKKFKSSIFVISIFGLFIILSGFPSLAQQINSSYDYSTLLQSGISKHKKHRYQEAIADYDKAIQIAESPGNPYADPQSEYYDKAYYLSTLSDLYFNRGLAKSESGDPSSALTDFTRSIKYNPQNDSAIFNRGIVEYELSQYKEALRDFNKTIALVPGDAKALYNRALTKYELGDERGAISDAKLSMKYFKMLNKRQEYNEVNDFISSMNQGN